MNSTITLSFVNRKETGKAFTVRDEKRKRMIYHVGGMLDTPT
jgi:hypothetical protein